MHQEVWNSCLKVIKDNVPSISYRTWFEPIVPLKVEDSIFNDSGSESIFL
jgi:chromosomal replication initiator protein